MLVRPLDHPLNWYPYDVGCSLELLHAYVSDIEQQVNLGIARFEKEAIEVVIDGTSPEEPPRFITVHQGLDDVTWDLRSVCVEYFPGLQRRSALITLFSFFEHELNKLCSLFQTTEKYELALREVAGTGVDRARTYLSKVAALDLKKAAGQWNEVKNIQMVRNLLVHADGRLPGTDEADRGGVRKYVASCVSLGGQTEISIHAGYLEHVLGAFDAYFREVHTAIRRRYDA